LLGDHFKALTTGRNVASDLAEQAKDSRFLQQWAPANPLGLARPDQLPESNWLNAYRRDGSVTIHADARVYATVLSDGDRLAHTVGPGRHAWIHVATGSAIVDGERLTAGDAVAISEAAVIPIHGDGEGEVLLFDLA
jgi:redox-sensitive bicupin YhaK (pirin superfamily)